MVLFCLEVTIMIALIEYTNMILLSSVQTQKLVTLKEMQLDLYKKFVQDAEMQ